MAFHHALGNLIEFEISNNKGWRRRLANRWTQIRWVYSNVVIDDIPYMTRSAICATNKLTGPKFDCHLLYVITLLFVPICFGFFSLFFFVPRKIVFEKFHTY